MKPILILTNKKQFTIIKYDCSSFPFSPKVLNFLNISSKRQIALELVTPLLTSLFSFGCIQTLSTFKKYSGPIKAITVMEIGTECGRLLVLTFQRLRQEENESQSGLHGHILSELNK